MTSLESDKGLVQSYSDFAGLARLRGQVQSNAPDATRTTAQQFEAMFIQMMLKSMRAAAFRSDLVDSQTLDTYESMQDQELSVQLAKRGALGIADMLQRQLSKSQGASGADKPAPVQAADSGTAETAAKAFALRPALPAAMVLRPAEARSFDLMQDRRPNLKNLGPVPRLLNHD